MDMEKCRLLLTIADCGSFTTAASLLGYTPSGVSRAVESVEAQAGFPLFLRGRKGAVLTREGEALLPILRQMDHWGARYEEAVQALRGLELGEICVGTAYISYYPWLAELVAAFHRQYPGIKVQIAEGTSTELSRRLEQRQLDFGLISRREGNYRWFPLREDQLLAVLPRSHPLAGRRSLRHTELLAEPFVEILPGSETDNSRFFQRIGRLPVVGFSSTDSLAAFSMVRAGLGLTLINSRGVGALPEELCCLPLDPPEKLEVGIILPPEDSISPAARRFFVFAGDRLGDLP
ncbi:MAG: LysR family transcriptional regulator [Oscillospiraceae bacterium]|nr:LysR family transcriptional regulator [Oscillospiraceae bacterium]